MVSVGRAQLTATHSRGWWKLKGVSPSCFPVSYPVHLEAGEAQTLAVGRVRGGTLQFFAEPLISNFSCDGLPCDREPAHTRRIKLFTQRSYCHRPPEAGEHALRSKRDG